MRLAILVTEFPKVTETFILRDCVEFARRGHEVRIYPLTAPRHAEVLHEFASQCQGWVRRQPYLLSGAVLGALLRACTRRPGMLARCVARIAQDCWRDPLLLAKSLAILPKSLAYAEELAAWRAEHVHAEFAGHPATSAWIIGRAAGLPYSVSCRAHDIYITQLMLGTKLAEASWIRTVSEYGLRFLREHIPQIEDRVIDVIHSSVDIDSIPLLGPPPSGRFRVLYVGSLYERKGVDDLLEALASVSDQLGDWECRVIGTGSEAARLQDLSRELGLESHVRFLGAQPFEEVSKAYEAANVVAAPSRIGTAGRTEGIPNVVIEALAYQRPVISTRVSGIPELVKPNVTGFLVEPGAPSQLADALLCVYRDPDLAYRLACEGRRAVEKEFSLHANAAMQLAHFEELAKARLEAESSR